MWQTQSQHHCTRPQHQHLLAPYPHTLCVLLCFIKPILGNHYVTVGPVPHASASGFNGLPIFGCPDCNDNAPVEIANDRPWPPHQDTTDLDGVIPRQRMSSAYSPLPPSTTCGQASPEPLARALSTDSSDRPLGLVRGCGLDNSSKSLNVTHSAYYTFFREGCVWGTTRWCCCSSISATQPRIWRPSCQFETHVCSLYCARPSSLAIWTRTM